MKRILFLILGYWLYFQAGIGVLSMGSAPEHAVLLLPLSGLCGWGGYKLIQIARRTVVSVDNQSTTELPVPDTQPLERKS